MRLKTPAPSSSMGLERNDAMTNGISTLRFVTLIAAAILLVGVTDLRGSTETDSIAALLLPSENPSTEQIEDALAQIPAALLEAQRQERFADKALLLQRAAELSERKGDWVDARRYWRSATELATSYPGTVDLGALHFQFAAFLRNAADPDAAITQLEIAASHFRSQREAARTIETQQEISLILAEKGEANRSLEAADSAVSSALAIGDLVLTGHAYRNRALCEMILQGSYQRELGHVILQHINRFHSRSESDPAVAERPPSALESLETAIGYFEQSGEQGEQANCLKLKGDVFLASGRIDEARAYYEEAYKAFSKAGKQTRIVDLQVAMAVAETLVPSIDSALRWINAAISSEANHPDLPWILLLKAEIALQDFNDPLARSTLLEALEWAESQQDLDPLIALQQLRSLVEINLGNYREGFAALDAATQYQVEQVLSQREQVEKRHAADLQELEHRRSEREQARTQALESQLFQYQVFARNSWIVGITFAICFIGLLALRLRNQKQKQSQLLETQTQLRDTQEALRQANDDRNTIFKHLAQELRTPMNGIVGAIPLLHDTNLTPLQENCVSILDASSRSITTLINDISDLSQLDSGRLKLIPMPVSLTQVVETVVQLFEADGDHGTVDVLSDVPSDPLPGVDADPNRLQQILITLTTWAMQNTSEGHVLLRLEWLEPHSERTCSIRMTIENSGHNSALDTEKELFELHPTAGAQSGSRTSSMMGMSLAKKLVDAMNGSITVAPTKMGGTRIQVLLPFTLGSEKDSWQKPEAFERFPRKRALIIDSSHTATQILAKHLRSWALHHEIVEDVNSASNILENSHGFDVIFLDCVLADPELNLLEQIAAIRSHEGLEVTPIILMSRFSELNSSLELKRQPFLHQLPKPLTLYSLHTALRQALHHKSPVSKSYAKLTPELPPKSDPADEQASSLRAASRGFQFMPYILPMRRDVEVDPGLTILLAEDNLVNQKVTSLMLKKMGYDIDIVPNGRKAVEAVQTGSYDVVLMDKNMPVLDGLGAAREIRKLENIEQPIIIALTASATMEDEIACRKATMDNFLAKPVQLDKMKASLGFATHELKQRRRAAAPSQASALDRADP